MAAIVSVGLIFTTLVVCDFLRNAIAKRSDGSLASRLATDVLVMLELCTVSFELGVVFEGYGVHVWLCGLYLNCFYQCVRWRDLTFPSPYVHVIEVFSGRQSFPVALLRCAVLLAAGLATYRYWVSPVWAWEMSEFHVGRHVATSVENCQVPWKTTPIIQAFATEFFGTFVLFVGHNLVANNPTLQNNDPLVSAAILAAMVAATVYASSGLSGGMFSPVLATVLLGGCDGHSMWQHVLIYWVGAMAGAMFGYVVFPHLKVPSAALWGAEKRESKKIN